MQRTRIPRRRDGARQLVKLDTAERTLLAALTRAERAATGATVAELCVATGLSRGQVAGALRRLSSAQRCGPLGAVALGRVYDADGAPTERWGLTREWCLVKRTPLRPDDAPARAPETGALAA